MPAEQVDAMVAARDAAAGAGAPLPAARPGRSPLVTLLAELERRPSLRSVEIVSGGRAGGVAPWLTRRCGSTTSAGSCSTSTGRCCTAARRPRPPAARRGRGARAHPRHAAAGWCCSPTAATCRRRGSRPGCATTGCRSPTTRCSPRSTAPSPGCCATIRSAPALLFASRRGVASTWRRRGCGSWPTARSRAWCSWPTSTSSRWRCWSAPPGRSWTAARRCSPAATCAATPAPTG